jgi:uncharacterized protein (DUF849 family)
MSKNRKVIITCAPTGAIHAPSMSPHLPVSADDIAQTAIDAAQAGAAILHHLHARDPVINITTGGSPHMTVEDRMRPVMRFQTEVASLNMSSMSFGLLQS